MSDPEIEIKDAAPGAPGGLDFGKVFKYAGILGQVIGLLEAAGDLADGEELPGPEIRFRYRGDRVVWDTGTLTKNP